MAYIIRILLLGFIVFSSTSCEYVFKLVGGNYYSPDVKEARKYLSPATLEFMDKHFKKIGNREIHDFHTHIVAVGDSDSGAYIHDDYRSFMKSPKKWFLMKVYMSTLGVQDQTQIDKEFVKRLVSLVEDIPLNFKIHLFAFDEYYDEDGDVQRDKTEFHIPNEYSYRLSQQHPKSFIPVISVHPYRNDAIEELEKWANKGVRYIKWLPNAMGINPSHPKTTAYYKTLIKHNMVLLSHAGHESAVESDEHHLGNPLLLRKPLDMGVKVIMAHCAVKGTNEDLDNPGTIVPNFELFKRLIKDPKYKNNLRGGLSALALNDRLDDGIVETLELTQTSDQYIYGSDYPIPAFNSLISVSKLVKKGLIEPKDENSLKEIYKYNPLLFPLLLSLSLKHPENGVKYPTRILKKDF